MNWERVVSGMNSTTGDGPGKKNGVREAGEAVRAVSQPSNAETDLIPAGFTREYHVLVEVCASMSSGFMLLNQQERVIYSNASALRLLRIGEDSLVDARNFDVREHLLSIAANPQLAQNELERVWHSEQEYAADLALAAAAVRWLRVRTFPVHNDQGRLLGRGVLFDDITLERSAIEERSETLAMAAHELKTPLAIIKGCATTLLGGSARWDPAMQREMLQMIDTQSDRLYDILNTLLDVWRLDTGTQPLRLTQVHIPELLDQLVRRWQQHAPEHRFVLRSAPAISPVLCDVMRIEQAVNHLLHNAVTYSKAGTTITIQLEADEIELRIAISDEGAGIAPEHLDRIFERFFRVPQEEEDTGGSGLGLASARATVEAHGGRIWADSPGPGCGATFYFTLPFTPPAHLSAASAVSAPATVKEGTPGPLLRSDKRIRVLLAEKDPRLTRYLRANLEEQHYRVQAVSHGIQCLRQMDLEEPDVILLSTQLADMNGVELLRRLREFSQTPVLMLCDECDEDERVQLFDLGSDDLVLKPFGMKELMARVRALLRRRTIPGEQAQQQTTFVTGALVIDYAQHLVTVEGRVVQLSRTEYRLLSVLAQNVGMVVTHELLLEKVWGPEYNREIDFIWVYISRLRRKIESDPRHPRYILTVPDVGYKLAKL